MIFRFFHNNGLDVNQSNIYGQSVLFAICKNNNQEILQYLTKDHQQGNPPVEVNATDQFGRTPIFYAAEQGNLTICEILLKIGALVNIKDNDGHTASYYAKKHSKSDVVQLMAAYKEEPSLPEP
jgi:ankyrin repeat protein